MKILICRKRQCLTYESWLKDFIAFMLSASQTWKTTHTVCIDMFMVHDKENSCDNEDNYSFSYIN